MPQASTISNELINRIEGLLAIGKQYPKDTDFLHQLEHDSKQLCKANASDGYIALAGVSMLRGDFDEMRERYLIANNQSVTADQRLNYVTILSKAGFFSEAAEIANRIKANLNEPIHAFVKTALCFQFSTSTEIFDKALHNGFSPPKGSVKTRNEFSDISRISGNNDVTLAKLADIAGEVMRERQVFFKAFPIFSFSTDDAGKELVVASFMVPLTYDDASEMTLRFAEKIISRGISNDNFYFHFRGHA